MQEMKLEPSHAMAFAAMALLGGLGTRQPLTNAMNALGAAIKGVKDGDEVMFNRAYKQFKMVNDSVLARNDYLMKEFDSALKGRDQTLEERKSKLDFLNQQATNAKESAKDIDESIDRSLKAQKAMQDYRLASIDLDSKLANLRLSQAKLPYELRQAKANAQEAELKLRLAQKEQENKLTYGIGKIPEGMAANPETKRLEYVVGTPLYEEARNKYLDEADKVQKFGTQTQDIADKMQSLLDSSGFNVLFPDVKVGSFVGAATQYLAPDTRNRLAEVQSLFSVEGLARIRENGSPGAITEREWPIMRGIVAEITPGMSADGVKEKLQQVLDKLNNQRATKEAQFAERFSNSQFYEPQELPPLTLRTTQGKTESTDEELEFEQMRLQEGR